MNIRNNFRLIGHLGADPEVKQTKNGRSYCNFSICVNKRYKDKDSGETRTISSWFYPTIWGKKAETFASITSKGIQIAIDGELSSRQVVDDQSGKKYHVVDQTVDNFEILTSKRSQNNSSQEDYQETQMDTSPSQSSQSKSQAKSSSPVISEDEGVEDSIDFNLDEEDNSFEAAIDDDDSDIPF